MKRLECWMNVVAVVSERVHKRKREEEGLKPIQKYSHPRVRAEEEEKGCPEAIIVIFGGGEAQKEEF